MNEPSSNHLLDNQQEQVGWLSYPVPGKIESLKKWVSTRIGTLFDGGYFGFTGELILVPKIDEKTGILEIIPYHPPRHKIIACNPGAKKVSRLLPMYVVGDSLAVKEGEGSREITYVEAQNDGLVKEVAYTEVFRYIGNQDALQVMSLHACGLLAIRQLFGTKINTGKPETAFQVTKTGSENLLLINRKSHTSWNMPFSGDGGTFRRRRRATV